MATTTTLQLGSINLGNDTWSIAATSVNDTLPVGPTVSVATGKPLSQALGGYGSLKLDVDSETLILQGGSELKGDVSIGGSSASLLSAVSFGAAVSVSLGSGFDKLTNVKMGGGADTVNVNLATNKDFNLNTGAGNDMVIIETVDASSKIDLGAGNDLVSVAGVAGEVVLGAGKDTLRFGDNATVTASDYNFNDDVIVLDNATLTADGKLTAAGIEVNGLTATNGVYFAKVNGTGAATTILATAEEDAGKVVITDTVSKNENVIIIDAESADSANITLGKASLASVALKAGNDAVDTIKIGDTKATVNAVVTGFSTDDVLNFTGLTFKNSTIGVDSGAATLSSGKVSVNLGTGATVNGGVAFNLNGTKLYATSSDDAVLNLTEETDLSKILVKGHNDVSKVSGIKTSAKLVNLDADNIYNIDYVKLTADTAAKASVIGTKNDKAGITIDASEATDGVAVWANNSSTKKGDLISLAASSDGVDTLWFGTADGADTVKYFNFASDVLYLYDALTLTAEGGSIKAGKATMTFENAENNAEEILQVQGAKFAGTVYAAGDFNTASDVINLGENAGKVNYYAVGKDAKVALTSTMTDSYTFLNSIDYAGATKANIAAGGSVASINASDTTYDSKIIIEGVAKVTLGAGTNEYWANGAKDAVVDLNGTENVDKIWFSASDKKVTVSGSFETGSDVIALMGSIGEFTAKKDNTDAVISNANKGALTIKNVTSDINLVDANGAKYKLYVADAPDYTTNTDGTNIYLGTQLNASSEVTAATNIVVEGANNKWGIASSAIVGESVKTIDMSASSADFVLIGSANAANTITGGTGTNYLNGGGASKDVLNGVTGAVDNFYYGKEDGNDTIVNIGAEDIVQLYDVATADLVNVNVKDDKTVITLNNGRKLTINNSIADGATFVLTDGTYVFDSSVEGNWVQK